ncbi:kinesin-like protein KIF19 [Pleurodeles waltl]|uniref:kinesin-like protein KIF19 n=1 Tax=Pleurodeles waltl TaxID=8319 RepID=UPI00370960C9
MKDQRGGPRVQQLTVALRIRPMNEAEIDDEASFIAHKLGKQMVVLMDPTEDPDDILRANRTREKTFVFDMVFDAKATQAINVLSDGYNYLWIPHLKNFPPRASIRRNCSSSSAHRL